MALRGDWSTFRTIADPAYETSPNCTTIVGPPLTTCGQLRYGSPMSSPAKTTWIAFRLRWLSIVCLFLQPVPATGNSETLLSELNKLSPAEREKKLLEGAKREGSVIIYSSENVSLLQRYEAAFVKRYPFVKAEYWRAGGDRVGTRVLTESRAGRLQADLVGLAFDVVNEIKGAGILARYHSPERKAYADMFKDSDGYFTPTNLIHAVIGYNTKLVSARDAPRDYADLLSPFWKGSLTIDTEPSRALLGWLKAWGEEKTRKYLEGLVRNDVKVTRGHTLQTQLLCAGEYKAGVELYLYTAAQMQRTGCPINIVYPTPTSVASAQSWSIPVAAPHPHAAALLLDFLLSAEGADLVANHGRIPARSGVRPKFETLDRLASGAVPLLVLTSEDAHRLRAAADKLFKEVVLRK
jgi:iron(III) transport system substrate-binding protein